MLASDIKLLHKLHSESDLKTIESVVEEIKKSHDFILEKVSSGNIPEHLQGLDNDTAPLHILSPSTIYSVLSIGIYQAHESKDMSVLNNSLYTYNRLRYYPGVLNKSGYDHCIYLMNALESFAGNDIELVRKMFSKDLGQAKVGHRLLVMATNLMMAIIWNDEAWKEASLKATTKFLTLKNGRTDDLLVQYLIAIINQDMAKASEYLAESCMLYKKNGFVHNFRNPFLKVFGAFIHGLYNMAYHVLPAEKFEQLAQPDHTIFWKDFADHNKATRFTAGKPFIIFENELGGLNKIYG
jgi:hypothetical protein